MMSNFPELSLDLSPPVAKRFDPDFVSRLGILEDIDCRELKGIDEFINRLEDELTKIQAFKRELPISFLLLTDAVGRLKEEARKRGEREKEGKLDEVVGVNVGSEQFEKKDWMRSAQLWSPRDEDDDTGEWQPCKYKGHGGAFSSFKESQSSEEDAPLPGLSLVTPGSKPLEATEPGSKSGRSTSVLPGSVYYPAFGQAGSPPTRLPFQTGKKRRRSWSPELHRRFVEALEKLGGSQVATPKQIRELMQVDGLTNDEVKSHLQKYRLHVRKLPTASKTSNSPSKHVTLGIDQLESSHSNVDLLHSSSPEGPLHFGGSGKCVSGSMEDLDYDDNDENSDGHC